MQMQDSFEDTEALVPSEVADVTSGRSRIKFLAPLGLLLLSLVFFKESPRLSLLGRPQELDETHRVDWLKMSGHFRDIAVTLCSKDELNISHPPSVDRRLTIVPSYAVRPSQLKNPPPRAGDLNALSLVQCAQTAESVESAIFNFGFAARGLQQNCDTRNPDYDKLGCASNAAALVGQIAWTLSYVTLLPGLCALEDYAHANCVSDGGLLAGSLLQTSADGLAIPGDCWPDDASNVTFHLPNMSVSVHTPQQTPPFGINGGSIGRRLETDESELLKRARLNAILDEVDEEFAGLDDHERKLKASTLPTIPTLSHVPHQFLSPKGRAAIQKIRQARPTSGSRLVVSEDPVISGDGDGDGDSNLQDIFDDNEREYNEAMCYAAAENLALTFVAVAGDTWSTRNDCLAASVSPSQDQSAACANDIFAVLSDWASIAGDAATVAATCPKDDDAPMYSSCVADWMDVFTELMYFAQFGSMVDADCRDEPNWPKGHTMPYPFIQVPGAKMGE